MASKATIPLGSSIIAEHDVVRLLRPMSTRRGIVAVGERGTVVHIHRGGTAFEVEFGAPIHVVTVMADQVERAPG